MIFDTDKKILAFTPRSCTRIGTVVREVHFESIFFLSFEANSYPYSMKMSGKKGRNGLSAVGLLFSDRLHGSAVD